MPKTNRNYIFLTKRVKKVMKTLANAENPLKISDIAERNETSARLVYYDLDFINMYLQRQGYQRIEPEDSSYSVTKQQRDFLNEMLSESVRVGEKDNRLAYIICSLIFQQQKITIDYLMMTLSVSRNTTVSDLQEAVNILNEYGLKVLNNKKTGYYVEGDSYTKKYVFIHFLSLFTKSSNYHFMDVFDEDDVQNYIDNVSAILDNLSIKVKNRQIIIIAYLMMIIRVYDSKSMKEDVEVISSSLEYELVCKYFDNVNRYEKHRFALLLMSLTMSKTLHTENEDIIYNLSKRIIKEYEDHSGCSLMDYDTLVYKMYRTLMFNEYCYGFDLPIPYVFTEEIRNTRNDIYSTIEQIIDSLKIEFTYPLYESDIASLSLLIAAHIPFDFQKKVKRVLVVTNNIYDLKSYLVHEIQSISQNIEIVDVIDSTKDINQYSYDYLVSTAALSIENDKYVRVSEIISDRDRSHIAKCLNV